MSFLKGEGYLCFITSSQWLDTDYGFKLQDWILRNFEIVAVLESRDEPWFVGARVATTVTILHRQQDASERMKNTVRFVQIRKPMTGILAHDGTTAGAVIAADRFRDELLDLTEDTLNSRYRARLVRQGDLWMEGVRLGVAMGKSKTGPVEESGADPQPGEYHGGKWGVHLRAPDLWFELLTRFNDRLAPLAQIAEVHRGITTGKDSFFYPKDASKEALTMHVEPATFKQAFRAERKEVESGEVKIVLCGEGYEEMRPIEAHFLEPEVHSLMEIKGYTARAEDCPKMIILVPTGREELEDTHALRYIEWGEEQGVDQGLTVKGNVTADREARRRPHSRWLGTSSPRSSATMVRCSAPMTTLSTSPNPTTPTKYQTAELPPRTTGSSNSTLCASSTQNPGKPRRSKRAARPSVRCYSCCWRRVLMISHASQWTTRRARVCTSGTLRFWSNAPIPCEPSLKNALPTPTSKVRSTTSC